MRVCAVTNVYNEGFNLPIWLRHYGRQVGPENLIVLDHGSDDGSTSDLRQSSVVRLPRRPFDDMERANLVSSFAAGLLNFYDAVIYSDCDEILVADPRRYANLAEFAAGMRSEVATAIGLNVKHNLETEELIAADRPILPQRSLVQFVSPMCKSLVVRKPVSWGGGFHSCDHQPVFGDLYLFHLREADVAQCMRKLSATRRIAFKSEAAGGHQRITYSECLKRSFMPVAAKPVTEGFDFSVHLDEFRRRLELSRTHRWHVKEQFFAQSFNRIPDWMKEAF